MSSTSGNLVAQAVSNSTPNKQLAMGTLVPPSLQVAKEGSVQLQSAVRGLKDNYVEIEQQIDIETAKQVKSHQERYATALAKIHQLKKVLKTEVEQRKNAEEHFRVLIEQKSQACLS